jgi:DNA invertase Pin-like site-specific DNA recombinase
MSKALRAALYLRVSTTDGGQDVRNQLIALRRFAQQQGWRIVGEYRDEATASNGNRPGFRRMWDEAAQHGFEVLLFWSLDRLTREGTFKTLTYLERLSHLGIGFKSYTEQYIDSLGTFSEAIVGILAAVAKQERIRISERTKAGLERARKQGKQLGRPAKALDIRKARQLRAQGLSLRAVGKQLHASPALVLHRLKKGGIR